MMAPATASKTLITIPNAPATDRPVTEAAFGVEVEPDPDPEPEPVPVPVAAATGVLLLTTVTNPDCEGRGAVGDEAAGVAVGGAVSRMAALSWLHCETPVGGPVDGTFMKKILPAAVS